MRVLDDAARRLLDRLALHVRPGATATRQGGHRSPVLASGVEFADHRAYVPGDDFRRIDWKKFAQNGALVLRQFEEERDARIYVMLDLSGSMARGKPTKIEVGKKIAAAFAYVGMKRFDRSIVLPFGGDLERESRPLRTGADLPDVDRFLTECSAGGETQLPQAVRTMAERFPKRGLVVVVSDLMKPEGFPEAFRTLGALGHELRVVQLSCEEDRRPKLEGELELFDAESGQTVRLRMSKDLAHAYTKIVDGHMKSCRDACRRAGGRFVEIEVEGSGDAQLKRAFAGNEKGKPA
jgi:uncharacterized protein (DUF58 family)